MPRRRTAPAVVVVALLARSLCAQASAEVPPFTVVRWQNWYRGSDATMEGAVQWTSGDSLRAMVDGHSVPISLAAHPELRIRGERRSRGRATLIGLGVGAGFGVALGALEPIEHRCTGTLLKDGPCLFEFHLTAAGGAISFGLAGAIIGATIDPGFRWHSHRAHEVSGAIQVRPMVTLSNGRAVGVNIGF